MRDSPPMYGLRRAGQEEQRANWMGPVSRGQVLICVHKSVLQEAAAAFYGNRAP